MARVDALESLFNPRRVALIGASTSFGKWGNIIPANIINGGYKGELFLVNPKGGEIHGLPVYRSLSDINKEIDMAMITIPAEGVEGVLEDCSRAGAKAVIVISGGFSESSPEGRRMEESMVRAAHNHGIRIVGPNTMGIYSSQQSLTALMPPVKPRPGHIAFAAQSGNLGTQMLGWGAYHGIGFSRFVCIGNKCDLGFEDYLEFFSRDEQTRTVLFYVEGFKNPRRILELAERSAHKKPLVIFKSGDTKAGSRAAASHSAAMAGSRDIYRGMIHQGGMIQAETTEEMLDFSDALVKMPIPLGKRVAILSWGGGWGVITADLCERNGLEVAPLPEELIESIGKILPSYWSKGNPVDLVGTFDLDAHTACLELLASSPEYDIVITLGTINATSAFKFISGDEEGVDPSVLKKGREYIEEKSIRFSQRVIELMQEYNKPIITVGMPQREAELVDSSGFPMEKLCIYTNPERAVRVMAMLAWRGQILHSRGV